MNKLKILQNKLFHINYWIQKHFIAFLIIIIIIIISIHWILFEIDNYNLKHNIKVNFNRNKKSDNEFESSSFIDSLHYTLTSFSTVGYGDITPNTTYAKVWTSFMHIMIIIISLKLFEYIYTPADSGSIQSLTNEIKRLNDEKSVLEKDKLNLINENQKIKLMNKNITNNTNHRDSSLAYIVKKIKDNKQIIPAN
jgi:hypothetical protein